MHEEKDSLNMMTVGSLEPEYDDAVAAMMIEQLGGSRSYVRERRQAMRRVILSEIYSPPRVTKEIKHGRWRHILLGFALDLTVVDPTDGMPWDFSRRTKRERARDIMREQKPYMLIGSPACKAFSTWMNLNRARSADTTTMDKALADAKRHVEFVISLYREQIDAG